MGAATGQGVPAAGVGGEEAVVAQLADLTTSIPDASVPVDKAVDLTEPADLLLQPLEDLTPIEPPDLMQTVKKIAFAPPADFPVGSGPQFLPWVTWMGTASVPDTH